MLIIHPEICKEDWEYIRSTEVPFVVVHFKPRSYDYTWMNYLFTDHEYGGYLATKSLIQEGAKNILCLREDSREVQFEERTAGYRRALEEAGIAFRPEYILGGDCSFEFGFESVMQRREELARIDGIFAEADLVALGVIAALKELGIAVPGQVKVVGYDDTELGKYFRPKLTTIHQPREEHARLACQRLIEMLESGDAASVLQKVLRPLMMHRETC